METKITNLLLQQSTYSQLAEFRLKVYNGNHEAVNSVQAAILSILKDNSGVPIQKLMAVLLAKDCMELFNDDFVAQSQKTILPYFERIALFSANQRDPEIGKYLFSDNPNPELAMIGKSLMRLTIECIWVWSKWFPVDPDTQQLSYYKISQMRLQIAGVRWEKIFYFKYENVVKHIPEMTPPIKMLRQPRKAMIQDFQSLKGLQNTRYYVERLTVSLKSVVQKNKEEDKFYSDIFHRCFRKIIRLREKGQTIDQGIKQIIQNKKKDHSYKKNNGPLVTEELEQTDNIKVLKRQNRNLQQKIDEQSLIIDKLQKELEETKVGARNRIASNDTTSNRITFLSQYSNNKDPISSKFTGSIIPIQNINGQQKIRNPSLMIQDEIPRSDHNFKNNQHERNVSSYRNDYSNILPITSQKFSGKERIQSVGRNGKKSGSFSIINYQNGQTTPLQLSSQVYMAQNQNRASLNQPYVQNGPQQLKTVSLYWH